MLRIAVPAALAAVCAVSPVATASAADVRISEERRATPLNAYAGHLVWSSYRPDVKRYVLLHRYRGTTRRVPVPSRAIPFDADLGPAGSGKIAIVYSRCRTEGPETVLRRNRYSAGSGCDLYRVALSPKARERKLSVSSNRYSETLPTLWRNTLVFARRDERSASLRNRSVADAYVAGRPSRRIASGPSGRLEDLGDGGTRGGPGVIAMDLRGSRLFYTWGYAAPDGQCGASGGELEYTELRFASITERSGAVIERAGCPSESSSALGLVLSSSFDGTDTVALLYGNYPANAYVRRAGVDGGPRIAQLPAAPGSFAIPSLAADNGATYYLIGDRSFELRRRDVG